MRKEEAQYNEYLADMFPEIFHLEGADNNNGDIQTVKTITFQVTEDCSLRCTYCYQINKSCHSMTFDTAKGVIDLLFSQRTNPNFYFYEGTTKGIIIEFIGGEPLLKVDLISQIIDYFEMKFIEYPDCLWGLFHAYSMISNGVAYKTKKVQDFLQKYDGLVYMDITVDGCEELHNKCRIFPDGSGSYELAIDAAVSQLHRFGINGTKITVSPYNVNYVYQGIVNMIGHGFNCIHINCVYEEGWQLSHAQELYKELKKVADYIVENNLQDKIYIAFFDVEKYNNKHDPDGPNWCGSTSSMLAVDYKGDIYPCIRFMASSLGPDIEPYKIGSLAEGIGTTPIYKNRIEELYSTTKREQSTEECLNCPIESGCGWCTGYNYQKFGTIKKRATYICQMHKAAALASKYFYKKCRDKENYNKVNVTKEIGLEIIGEEEWNDIKDF